MFLIATYRPSPVSRKEGRLMFKRNGIWYVCLRDNGRKIQKSLGTSDKKLARAIEAKLRTEVIEGSYFSF